MAQFIYYLCMAALLAMTVHGRANECVQENDMKSLVFQRGRYTTSNKHAIMKHLNCKNGCNIFNVDTVLCNNIGTDGKHPVWSCETTLPDGFSLSSTSIRCEGCSHPGDTNVVVGSCELSYSIRTPYIETNKTDPEMIIPAVFIILVIIALCACYLRNEYSNQMNRTDMTCTYVQPLHTTTVHSTAPPTYEEIFTQEAQNPAYVSAVPDNIPMATQTIHNHTQNTFVQAPLVPQVPLMIPRSVQLQQSAAAAIHQQNQLNTAYHMGRSSVANNTIVKRNLPTTSTPTLTTTSTATPTEGSR
jgi:hypothetical protein